MKQSSIPLCVDLDGTLIHGDMLLEAGIALLKRNPLYVFLLPWWALRGRAHLKAEIARRVVLNHAVLPFHRELLKWLAAEKTLGRPLWLCTGSNQLLAEGVATHLKLFDGVLASTDTHNLTAQHKADALVERFGAKAFDYCGNHRVDLPVWSVSHGGVLVNAHKTVEKRARAVTEIYKIFSPQKHQFRAITKALRLHQWVKNLLLLVPLAAAHRVQDIHALGDAALAFFAFGMCASSVYLLNDMLDLESDRQHPSKAHRPFASGQLSLLAGFALTPLLLAGAVAIALLLPMPFRMTLAAYYLLTLGYSFSLKRITLVDVIVLAGLYTVRIIAGAMAVSIPLSFWLLMFSVCLFFSLALVKRYAELCLIQQQGKAETPGRGYRRDDLAVVESLGTGSAYLSVLVLALYINNPAVEVLYRQPQLLWVLCILLLYWVSSVWMAAHRGTMLDDPVVYALKDKPSLAIGLLAAAIIVLAT